MSKINNKPLLDVLANKQSLTPSPVWFMRQAGRYLPEYRELRSKFPNFIEFCLTKEAVIEASLQPLIRYPKLDAAIIFSDILLIPYALGQEVNFDKNHGPQLGKIPNFDLSNNEMKDNFHKKLSNVTEAITLLSKEINSNQALIGFIGAPFTLLYYILNCYNQSKDEVSSKLQAKAELIDSLVIKLTEACKIWAGLQVEAGAEVIMIFESWAKLLTNYDKALKSSINPISIIADYLKSKYNIPVIVFAKESPYLLSYEKGCDCLAIDQHQNIGDISNKVAKKTVIMGNLDPEYLYNEELFLGLSAEVIRIIKACKDRPFIFNLGHGIDKRSNPDILAKVMFEIKNINNYV